MVALRVVAFGTDMRFGTSYIFEYDFVRDTFERLYLNGITTVLFYLLKLRKIQTYISMETSSDNQLSSQLFKLNCKAGCYMFLLMFSIAFNAILRAFALPHRCSWRENMHLEPLNKEVYYSWIAVNVLYEVLATYLGLRAAYLSVLFVTVLAKDLDISIGLTYCKIALVAFLWILFVIVNVAEIVSFSLAQWVNESYQSSFFCQQAYLNVLAPVIY